MRGYGIVGAVGGTLEGWHVALQTWVNGAPTPVGCRYVGSEDGGITELQTLAGEHNNTYCAYLYNGAVWVATLNIYSAYVGGRYGITRK